MEKYNTKNHWKGLIKYHIIFICKYRRKIFNDINVANSLKDIMIKISNRYDFKIETHEIDLNKPDHYHCLINSSPTISPLQIIHVLKQ